jgi:hypothetical protein
MAEFCSRNPAGRVPAIKATASTDVMGKLIAVMVLSAMVPKEYPVGCVHKLLICCIYGKIR